MVYIHYVEPQGDNLLHTLRKLRKKYGDNWTDTMEEYDIKKSLKIGDLKWREPIENDIPHEYYELTFRKI